MRYKYRPRGTCSQEISFDINEGIVTNLRFVGGCSGNSKGVSALAEGQRAEEIISRCKGITCGYKPTSCPDQLAKALEEAIANEN